MAEETGAPRPGGRRAALAFIFVTIGLDMIAMGIVIPVLPQLVLQFMAGDTATAVRVTGVFSMVWALMQFLWSPFLGALSDRFGRRPVVLISNFGLGLDYILMALAPGITLLFVGRIIAGITAASISTSGAYIADVMPPEKRAGAFGMMSVFFGLGFILGPGLGGLLGAISPRLPFWVAAGLSLANATYGLFVLPESLPPEKRGKFSWRRASPLGSFQLLRSHRELFGLATISFVIQIAHASLPSVFVLYGIYRYGWDSGTVGGVLSSVGFCQALVGGGLVRPAVSRLGERLALLVGLACGMIAFLTFGIASTGIGFVLGVPIMALWGLAGPALQGLMSRRIAASEQGQLQGALSSLAGIAGMFSPGLFTGVFAYFIEQQGAWHQPGAPFLLAAGIMAVAVTVAVVVARRQPVEAARVA
jgi:DHA1 family tetracycline resistance protein-like MFS transporter